VVNEKSVVITTLFSFSFFILFLIFIFLSAYLPFCCSEIFSDLTRLLELRLLDHTLPRGLVRSRVSVVDGGPSTALVRRRNIRRRRVPGRLRKELVRKAVCNHIRLGSIAAVVSRSTRRAIVATSTATAGTVLRRRLGGAQSLVVVRRGRVVHDARARAWARSIRCARSRAVGANLPEPGVVVDDLDFLATKDAFTCANCLVGRRPPLEVDEDALELIAVLTGPGNHVNVVNLAQTEGLEHIRDALLGNILEDSRNAQAGNAGREKSHVN
jgi:hypothetical protein